jgi:leucine dehydrogenase
MESLIRSWDGEFVVTRFDRPTNTWMFVVIHSTALGVATGGTRLKSYPNPRDALLDGMRLAEGMTYKWAGVDFPRGGGKAVLDIPENFDPREREGLITRYGQWLNDLNGIFETGADLGTNSQDMALIARNFNGVFGRPPDLGGAGDPGPFTALGVFSGIQANCEVKFGSSDLKGRTVMVQGVGSVGENLVKLLLESGCKVKFSDVDHARVEEVRKKYKIDFVEQDLVYREPCDVFSPCATGGILNNETIQQLQCSVVAGGANNQLATPENGEMLYERDILYAPDYIINAGGAIFLPSVEAMGWSFEKAKERVRQIGDTLRDVCAASEARGISTAKAADQLAKERVERARKKKTGGMES